MIDQKLRLECLREAKEFTLAKSGGIGARAEEMLEIAVKFAAFVEGESERRWPQPLSAECQDVLESFRSSTTIDNINDIRRSTMPGYTGG